MIRTYGVDEINEFDFDFGGTLDTTTVLILLPGGRLILMGVLFDLLTSEISCRSVIVIGCSKKIFPGFSATFVYV